MSAVSPTKTAELTLQKKLDELAIKRSGYFSWHDAGIEDIDKDIIQKLVLTLNEHPEIVSLDLSRCHFHDDGAWLGKLKYVRSLDISESHISPKSFLAIAENKNIQRLTMDGSIFGTTDPNDKILLTEFVQRTNQSTVVLGPFHESIFQTFNLFDILKARTAQNKKESEFNSVKNRSLTLVPATIFHSPTDDPKLTNFTGVSRFLTVNK